MIKQYNGARAEKSSGNTPLPKGAYVAKIMGAKIVEYDWGAQLVVAFDIAEGEYTGFFANQYRTNQNEDKKWKGNYRLTIPEESSQYFDSQKKQFNNLIYALQASNDGYQFDWDETKLKGKRIGVLFRNKEWEYNGRTGWTTECAFVTDIDAVRSGDVELPKDKPLSSGSGQTVQANFQQQAAIPANPIDAYTSDDDLPF